MLNYCVTLSLTVAILPRIGCSKFYTCNISTFKGFLQFHVSFPLLRRRHAKEPPSPRRLGWRHSKIPSRNLCLQQTSFKRSSLAHIRSTARSASCMSDESVEVRRSCGEEVTGSGRNCKCELLTIVRLAWRFKTTRYSVSTLSEMTRTEGGARQFSPTSIVMWSSPSAFHCKQW